MLAAAAETDKLGQRTQHMKLACDVVGLVR